MLAFYSAMTGAAIGGMLSLLVHRWRYSADGWAATADELCKDVSALADMASEFWLEKRDKDSQELALQQIRIMGALERLSQLRLPFAEWCQMADESAFAVEFGALNDAITGGNFTARERAADPERALDVQMVASDVVVRIRGALRRGTTWSASIERRLTIMGRSLNRALTGIPG